MVGGGGMTVLIIVLIILTYFVYLGLDGLIDELANINKSIKLISNKENDNKENSNMVVSTAHYQDGTRVKFTKEDLK